MSVYLVVLSSFLHSCAVPDPPICKMMIPRIIRFFLLSEHNQDISYRHGRDASFRIIDSVKFPTFTVTGISFPFACDSQCLDLEA